MDKVIQQLSKYGEVKTCKEIGNLVTIALVDFDSSATNSIGVMKVVHENFPEHNVVETNIIEENFVLIINSK